MRILFAKKKRTCEVSFRDTLLLAGIPIVTFKNGNKYFNFIIDTGATSSLINKSVINEFNADKIDGNDVVCGLDPNVEFKSEKFKIQLECDNEKFDVTFGAIDLDATFNSLQEDSGIYVSGILGSDFLERHKYILDYNKMIIYHNNE